MAKTVIKLTNDDDYDFIVIGIVCQHRDYRLCHELNQLLHINLNKKEDYSVFNNKRMPDKTRIDESELLSNLKNAKVILGVYRLEVLKLKSKDNLLF